MDSLITAAARALAAGDPLGALKRVALRDDAPVTSGDDPPCREVVGVVERHGAPIAGKRLGRCYVRRSPDGERFRAGSS
jgi:hypothetical protein